MRRAELERALLWLVAVAGNADSLWSFTERMLFILTAIAN